MVRICFFNHFHNGDLVANREFLRWAANAWPDRCYYTHVNNIKVLSDLPIAHVNMPQDLKGFKQEYHKIFQIEDTIYVNTWIGCYMAWASLDDVIVTDPITGLNWIVYHKMWKYIVDKLNSILQTSVVLPSHVPDFINNPPVDFYTNQQFLESKIDCNKTSILVSNGQALSGQSFQNHNMESWFAPLVSEFSQVQWIFTHATSMQRENVFYTNDIFNNCGCDLNEIAELSRYCKIILGRNSGPFLFCNTKDNMFNTHKTFIATGRVRGDCFPAGLTLNCDYYWLCDQDDQKTHTLIHEIISNKLYFQGTV
jgi:hypothetical protein